MADHANPGNGPTPMDYPEHERTYGRFLKLAKWGSIIVSVILIFMAIFLV